MYSFNSLTKKQKYFAVIFLIGFIIKYNYLLLRIFYVSSFTGLILKNLVLISFIIYFFFPLVKRKQGRHFLLLVLTIFSAIFIANLWYNKYFGDYLSFYDIALGQGVGPSKVLIRQIIDYWELIFISDLVLLGYFSFSARESEAVSKPLGLLRGRTKGSCFIVSVVIVLLLFGQIFATNSLLGDHSPSELYNKSTAGFVNVYGIIPLYGYEFYKSIVKNNLNIVEAKSSAGAETENNPKQQLNLTKDVNVITIQIESLDEKLIDYKYNKQEVTPFLNQLQQKSIYFENFYAQHVNGTFDAEFSFFTSCYPLNKNYAFRVNDMSEFPSIVRLFNERGYETMAFHGNEKEFFYRHKAFPDLGFDEFYSKEDFSLKNTITKEDRPSLGINDYDFFQQSLDYLEKAEEPFFAHFISLTSHTPFNFYPLAQSEEEFKDIEDPLVRDYFQSISFVDKSLQMFFAELESRGLAANTLVVIYGDHEAGIEKEEYASGGEFVMGKNIKPPEHVPLLIYHPEFESKTITQTGTTIDVGPTILDLLGWADKKGEFIGSSLLAGEEEPVLFLHELPRILYKDHLFINRLEDPAGKEKIEKIGYHRNKETNQVSLSRTEKENIHEVISYIKEFIANRR